MDITKELKKNQDLLLSLCGRLELLSYLNIDVFPNTDNELIFGITQVSSDCKKDAYKILDFVDFLISNVKNLPLESS